MKTKLRLLIVLLFLSVYPARAQTGFTYQGHLADNGQPFTGTAEMQFTLWDSTSGGTAVATNSPSALVVGVTNGLFNATLDFGAAAFNGDERWLEIALRVTLGPFTTLSPRQKITATPYAIRAANITGTLSAENLGGTYGNAVMFTSSANSFLGSFSGNGSGLSNVTATSIGGITPASLWQLGGNNVAPGQFFGSTNNQPLEFRANGRRALRLEPTFTDANHSNLVNVIGGSAANFVLPGIVGATIGGGGSAKYFGFPLTSNSISTDFGTIGGGAGNIVNGIRFGTIGGGYGNTNSGWQATIAGGSLNLASGSSATIGGGGSNVASGDDATVGGGVLNVSSGDDATVAGGFLNTSSGTAATVGGGEANASITNSATISGGSYNTNSGFSGTIGGGSQNWCNAQDATIAGGQGNFSGGWRATVGGGYHNYSAGQSSTVSGGQDNTNSANIATIGGGRDNRIEFNAPNSVIGGGHDNTILSNAVESVIGGGSFHIIERFSSRATISGGSRNSIGSGAVSTAIGGGESNIIWSNAFASTIGGGYQNAIQPGAAHATIPGGLGNSATNYAFAAGRRAWAVHDSAFVWAGGTTTNYSSTDPSTFNVYAANGVSFDYAGQRGDGRGNRWIYFGPLNAGNTLVAWNGARLSDGGTWSNASDKNRKTDFEEVDAQKILERLAALPVRAWRYTNENAAVKHIGPTAQDFKAAFGLGDDDKSIGTVDADGVALAAIQALNQKLEAERAENDRLKQRLVELERLVFRTGLKAECNACEKIIPKN